MSEYQRTMIIEAQADEVFDFVSDINNIPKYLPTVRRATQSTGDRIHIEGEAGGREYRDEGYFRVDPEARRLEWGTDDDSNYSGFLQVEDGMEEGFTAKVTVHLTFAPSSELLRQLESRGDNRDEVIDEEIDEVLRSIKSLCEEEKSRSKTVE